MTPEAHYRANEIRSTIGDIKREIERLSQAKVCPLLSETQNEVLRERVVDFLQSRLAQLEFEYQEL